MQAEVSKPDTKNQVGKFTFTVVVDQNTPHDQERLARRSEVIANWQKGSEHGGDKHSTGRAT